MQFANTIAMAWNTVRSNRVRTAITVAIITFGIMALICILTAIEAMKAKLTDSFSFMGANAFSIRYKERKINIGGRKTELTRKDDKGKVNDLRTGLPITYEEALAFKEKFLFPAIIGISSAGNRPVTVGYGSKKTNPNIPLFCGDEFYTALNGYTIAYGRNISAADMQSDRNSCLLGADVAKKIFPSGEHLAPGTLIQLEGVTCQVAGVLKPKGSGGFLSFDNLVVVPIRTAQRHFGMGDAFAIGVKVKDVHLVEAAMSEATGTFRSVRKLNPGDESNFSFEKSDRLAEIFINASSTITFSAIGIGLITLFGAAIGLMNIMLVAVNERTREVGLMKAIGGKNRWIRQQFIAEALIIALLGAVTGIILGLILGNLVGAALNTPFVIPWKWVLGGIFLCTLTGLGAGIYPAWKAARLDPISALRYE
jgi:putative ABC transport system permease protein